MPDVLELLGLYVPAAAKWLPDLRAELTAFPEGKHDDAVDALGLAGQLMDRYSPDHVPKKEPENERMRGYTVYDQENPDSILTLWRTLRRAWYKRARVAQAYAAQQHASLTRDAIARRTEEIDMTSTELVRSEIRRFLKAKEPEVICITGDWGVGKTYTWQTELDAARKQKEIDLTRYSYASLFGVNSLGELKSTLAENLEFLDAPPENYEEAEKLV